MSSEDSFESGNECFQKRQLKHIGEEGSITNGRQYILKIVVAGDGGVGKTSLLNRYVSDKFIDGMKMTIGTDFYSKVIRCENRVFALQLWDFGGELRFRFLLPGYCKGACGVILVFDLNDLSTLLNLKEWLQIVRENTADPVIILIGNKADITNSMHEDLIQEFCRKNRLDKFIPTSAKTGENVESVFQELTNRISAKW
ncbi:MAG: Rab family GTPase [Promethearchaeota archaeon]